MANACISVYAENFGSPETKVTAGKHTILIDEPKLFGGSDLAPSPVEVLLASIAGCICAIGQWQASQMGYHLNFIGIKIKGVIDSDAFFGKSFINRSGFQTIEIEISAEGDWSETEKSAWLIAVQDRCPVLDNIMNKTEVKIILTENSGDKKNE